MSLSRVFAAALFVVPPGVQPPSADFLLLAICAANGSTKRVPFPAPDYPPQQDHQGACHAPCMCDRRRPATPGGDKRP